MPGPQPGAAGESASPGSGKRFVVIGSGSSLSHLIPIDLPEGIESIAVNGAIGFTRRPPNHWFTLDLSEVNLMRLRLSQRRKGTIYHVAAPVRFARRIPQIRYYVRIEGSGHGRFRTKGSLCSGPRAIHTGNSAWGALQLACQLGPASKIALLGVDGYGPYAKGGTPGELGMMPDLFSSAVEELAERNIQVVNGSPHSIVDCFPRMTPEAALEWLGSN